MKHARSADIKPVRPPRRISLLRRAGSVIPAAAVVAVVAGCGSSGSLLTQGQRQQLEAQLTQIQQHYAAHDCSGAVGAVQNFETELGQLGGVDQTLLQYLSRGASTISSLVSSRCVDSSGSSGTTGSGTTSTQATITTVTHTNTTPKTTTSNSTGSTGNSGVTIPNVPNTGSGFTQTSPNAPSSGGAGITGATGDSGTGNTAAGNSGQGHP